MGKLVAVGMLALVASAADTSWSQLQRLRPGQIVAVSVQNEQKKGAFVANSADNITIRAQNGDTVIPRAGILRVTTKAPPHRARNMLIAVGIGVVVGLVVDLTVGRFLRNEGNPANARALIWGIPIGIGVGVGVAAGFPGSVTVYQR